MNADTYDTEAKFNIWSFYDPTIGAPREKTTRAVNLKYPVTVFRRKNRT